MVVFEWPDEEDDRNLVVLLRQAADAVDASVVSALGPVATDALGPLDARRLVDVHILRRLSAKDSSIAQLCDHLGRAHPSVVERVARLEALGLVDRSTSWKDARSRSLHLTRDGERIVTAIDEVLDALAHEWGDDLACAEPHPHQLRHLLAQLRQLATTG